MPATALRLTDDEKAQQVIAWLSDRDWRLNNLYWIKDERGQVVKFRPNWAQQALLDNLHNANLILKARQLGFTTLIQILQLDACLWRKNVRAATIAHTVEVAKEVFEDKVRFAYEHLPPEIKQMIPARQDSADTLSFANGSSFRVSNLIRGGTYQWLHITELAYVDREFPKKADEIRTGALNTVHPGQVINVESTARGKLGLFYELAEDARLQQEGAAALGLMDYKFHFFPWWRHPGYTLEEAPPSGVMADYFDGLTRHGIHLLDGQKSWYIKKAKTQKASMKAEFPSTPEEAFEGAEGIFFDCFDRDLHVVRPFKIPNHWTRFRSEDWGTARPFSVGWYAVASETVRTPCGKVIPRGALIKYREWYGVAHDDAGKPIPNVGIKSTPQRVGRGIVEREAAEKIAYHVADPAMWADVGGPTQARQQREAITKAAKELNKPSSDVVWRKGNNARVRRGKAKGGWDQMRERLIGEECNDGVERPMLYFFGTCVHSIRTIPGLMHDENNPEDVDTHGEDHAADECRYACMSRPYESPKPTAKKPMTDLGNVSLDRLWQEQERRAW